MLSESRSFLQTGDPAHVFAFYSQLDVIRRQLGDTKAWEEPDAAASDRYMGDAVEAFQTLVSRDIYAMRLKAETLPVNLAAYPSEFAAERLEAADLALSDEEKVAKAESVLDHADYSAIQEKLSDRSFEIDDINTRDNMQESLSLSDRFGLTVCYTVPNKEQFAQIVCSLAEKAGLKLPKDELCAGAERFALAKGGRSPRCAKQYVESLFC